MLNFTKGHHASVLNVSEFTTSKYKDQYETGYRYRYYALETIFLFFSLGWPLIVLMSALFLKLNTTCFLLIGTTGLTLFIRNLKTKLALIVTPAADTRLLLPSTSFFTDGFLFIENIALKEIRQFSGTSRCLDVVYNFNERFHVAPMNFSKDTCGPFKTPKGNFQRVLNRLVGLWSSFWLGMPIAQDVRSRVEIVANGYTDYILQQVKTNPFPKINFLEVAGGQLQSVILGIKQAKDKGIDFDYRVVSIEPDEGFAKIRALDLIQYYGLEPENFLFIHSKFSTRNPFYSVTEILKRAGVDPDFDIVSCIGLGDYYHEADKLKKMLKSLDVNPGKPKRIIVANVSKNYIERGIIHVLVQWPIMKYRSKKEWKSILAATYQNARINNIQTPNEIFNIATVNM